MTHPALAACAAPASLPPCGAILALDLGTTTGWAIQTAEGVILSGTVSFRPSRYDGGGMRYLRFRAWLEELAEDAGGLSAIWFEEVRRHLGTDAAHVYGGLLAILTAWAEQGRIPYAGSAARSGRIKRSSPTPADGAMPLASPGRASRRMRARGFSPAPTYKRWRHRARGRSLAVSPSRSSLHDRPQARRLRMTRRTATASSSDRYAALPEVGMTGMRFAPARRSPDEVKRDGWREQGLLAVSVDDERLSWPERELVRQLGEKLYGTRNEEKTHG